MPVYFGVYKINANQARPPNPSDQLKMAEQFLAAIKMQMASGDIKEVNEFVDANGGYFLSGERAI